jgi:guanylate kinase
MTYAGIILYGPPASGKDTITGELCKLDDKYAYFQKLKVGAGRTTGYRQATSQQLDALRHGGLLLHEVARYDSAYAVDTPELDQLLDADRIPVVHMGQVAGVAALREYRGRWLDVLLWCPKAVTQQRAEQRGSADVDKRVAVWDETLADLRSQPEPPFALSIRTDLFNPVSAARLIHTALTT